MTTFFSSKRQEEATNIDPASRMASVIGEGHIQLLPKKMSVYVVHGSIMGPKIADKKPSPSAYDPDELVFMIKLEQKEVSNKIYHVYKLYQYRNGAFVTQQTELLRPFKMLELRAELAIQKAKEAQQIREKLNQFEGQGLEDKLEDLEFENQERLFNLKNALALLDSSEPLNTANVHTIEYALNDSAKLLGLLKALETLEMRDETCIQLELDLLGESEEKEDDSSEQQDEEAHKAQEAQRSFLQESLTILRALDALTSLEKAQIENIVWGAIQEVLANEQGIPVAAVLDEQLEAFREDALLLQTLLSIAVVFNVNCQEVMLSLDGNLGVVGGESLSALFHLFVKALDPTRLVIFTNTAACIELGKQYATSEEARFVATAGVSRQLKQMVSTIQSRDISALPERLSLENKSGISYPLLKSSVSLEESDRDEKASDSYDVSTEPPTAHLSLETSFRSKARSNSGSRKTPTQRGNDSNYYYSSLDTAVIYPSDEFSQGPQSKIKKKDQTSSKKNPLFFCCSSSSEPSKVAVDREQDAKQNSYTGFIDVPQVEILS